MEVVLFAFCLRGSSVYLIIYEAVVWDLEGREA